MKIEITKKYHQIRFYLNDETEKSYWFETYVKTDFGWIVDDEDMMYWMKRYVAFYMGVRVADNFNYKNDL